LGSLLAFYFIPDSFLTLGVTATLICIGVFLEVYQFICERGEAAKQMQFFEIEQNVQEGNNFWVLEEKEREKKQNSVGSDIDLNEKNQGQRVTEPRSEPHLRLFGLIAEGRHEHYGLFGQRAVAGVGEAADAKVQAGQDSDVNVDKGDVAKHSRDLHGLRTLIFISKKNV
jgi:hypothetical protein